MYSLCLGNRSEGIKQLSRLRRKAGRQVDAGIRRGHCDKLLKRSRVHAGVLADIQHMQLEPEGPGFAKQWVDQEFCQLAPAIFAQASSARAPRICL